MNKDVSKQQVLASVFILIWIFIINVVTPLVTTLPAWPMFFVTIFFFILGGDLKNIKVVFLSGFVGITLTYLVFALVGVFAPIIGELPATAILLFLALGLIIVGGNWFPVCLNNIAFAYMTAATVDLTIINSSSTIGWLIMLFVGGAAILGGALGGVMLADKICNKEKKSQ